MKKEHLKEVVKAACETKALDYLNNKKAEHSKVLHISHTSWEMQPYLKPNSISSQEAKFIFLLRTRMLDVRINYRNRYKDIRCPNCEDFPDDQAHLLLCTKLCSGTSVANRPTPDYDNIFNTDLGKMVEVSRLIHSNFKKRKQLLKSKDQNNS